MAAKDALKQQVPTVGVWGLGKVKVESFPLGVDVPVEPMPVPPVHGVAGALSWHSVQLTVPVGRPAGRVAHHRGRVAPGVADRGVGSAQGSSW